MTRSLLAVLYVALALGANPVLAAPLDRATVIGLRQGEMRKLAIHKVPRNLPNVVLVDMAGTRFDTGQITGKYTLLNFWATWCAPCRREMPSLDALQKKIGGSGFQVVLVATGRNPKPAIQKFFKDANITALKTLRDPAQKLSGLMGVFGLPLTVILNPKGQEIARMRGDANWNSPEAIAFLSALVKGR